MPAAVVALIDAREQFEAAAGFPIIPSLGDGYRSADVSPNWLRALRAATAPDIWRHGVFAIERASGTAIATGGFKGEPDETGTVEVAYGVAPEYRGRGFATELADGLTRFAFADPRVSRVIAHTLPPNIASGRVLEKCGFTYVGNVVDPDDGEVCQWELKQLARSE